MSDANGSVIERFVTLGLRRKFTHLLILATGNRPILGADFLTKFRLLVEKNKCLVDSAKQFPSLSETPAGLIRILYRYIDGPILFIA